MTSLHASASESRDAVSAVTCVIMRASHAVLVTIMCASCRASESPGVAVDPPLRIGGHVVEPAAVRQYLAWLQRRSTSRGGRAECSYTPLGVSRDSAYLWVLCMELVREGDSLAVGTAGSFPMALRIDTTGPAPRVVGAWRPQDGAGNARSIRARFPRAAARLALEVPVEEHNARVRALEAKLRAAAERRRGELALEATPHVASPHRDTIRPPSVPQVRPDTAGAVWPASDVSVRCYRSPHSVLFGRPTRSGQQGRGPGWIRLEGFPTADSGSTELVDADRKGVGGQWRRAPGDSVSVAAGDHDLSVRLQLVISDRSVAGRARAHSDVAAERDAAGRLGDLWREWLLRATRASCDSMPVPWRLLPWR